MSNIESSVQNDFHGFRKICWPVHSYETKKVFSLALIMFFVLFNYTILRNAKDGLIITAPGSGAELISFLKLYGTLSFAIVIMGIYSKLSLILSKQNLFYCMISIFFVFFALFGYVLFPFKHILHMDPETITKLQVEHPRLYWFIPMLGNWTYSLFYIVSELWGTVCISVLFWQLANDTNTIEESKRFYPLFGIIGSLGVIASGYVLFLITNTYINLDPITRWDFSLHWIITILLVNIFIIISLYYYVQTSVMTDSRLYTSKTDDKKPDKKNKASLLESLNIVFSSKYIALIMMIIICYGVCINLVEVTWKSQMKLQFPDTAEYVKMMGMFSISTGFITIILTVIGSNVLRRCGWFTGAMVTPVMLLITGSLFYSFIIFGDYASDFLSFVNITPLLMAVIIGWVQNILTKGSKYSMFDPTKEMAYIPLSDGLRTRGKAAADGVGSRLGKSGGAIIQQVLLIVFVGSTQATLTPILAIIFLSGIFIWTTAVIKLNKEFKLYTENKKTSKSNQEHNEDTSANHYSKLINNLQSHKPI